MWDFVHYTQRFRVFAGDDSNGDLTPDGVAGIVGGLPNNHWYSFDVGAGTPAGVHFAAVSSEAYFYYNATQLQYEWLHADLAAVDRARTPWVVVFGHRSVYCSCDADCDSDAMVLRRGVGATNSSDGSWGIEALLLQFSVDLWLNGHEHNYERNYAVRNATLATGAASGAPGGNASAPEVLVDAAAPVYIISGSAGNVEQHEPFTRAQPPYSAFRSNTFGFGRLTVFNASALLWEAVQTDAGQPATTGSVIDAMLLLKTPGGGGARRRG